MAKRRVGTHAYVSDPNGVPDHNGDIGCGECYLPRRNTIHQLPEQHAEVTAAEARRLGERETGSE